MNSTASKNEINVEAQHPTLPLLTGRLAPWKRGRSLSAGSVAKFYPSESEHGTVWIPGQMFQVRVGGFIRTCAVERYMPAKEIPARVIDSWPGKRTYGFEVAKAHTIPECVVVRVVRAVAV